MPLIERKSLDRVLSSDVLYTDAGNLIKAGQKAGDNREALSRFSVSSITVINPTKEEAKRFPSLQLDRMLEQFVEKKTSGRKGELRHRLKETLMSLYAPFSEKDQSFQIPGKKNYLNEDDLLARKIDSLNREQVEVGSTRLINKYKLKFIVDIIEQIQSDYEPLKALDNGQKEEKGRIRRLHINSNRLNSWYDESRFRTMGDSLVNQAIDTALLYLHTFTNLNKKRIEMELPFSESRYDPNQRKAADGIYQYKPEFILEATIGVLLHNIGYAHQSIHKIISPKPELSPQSKKDQQKIRTIQKAVNVIRHLVDREDISSISRMICTMQRDYPDGTGFPSPNENRFLHEFVRLFHIVDFYDSMTNPVLTGTTYSRGDVIDYLIENAGEYTWSGEKFTARPRFDARLLEEFLDVLAPWEINEKVYLYKKGNREQPLFIGKVSSYSDSWMPLLTVLKDETKNREYEDGTVFMHIPSSSLYLKKNGVIERKVFPWIGELEIFDSTIDAGDISAYRDILFGEERTIHKNYR